MLSALHKPAAKPTPSKAAKSPYSAARAAAAPPPAPNAMLAAIADLAAAAARHAASVLAPLTFAARLAESARAARRAFAEAFVKHAIPALQAGTDALWRAVAQACLRVRRAP